MVSPPPSPRPDSLISALRYSDQFDYPLTLHELWFWQVSTRLSKSRVSSSFPKAPYYHLPGRRSIVATRLSRARYSQPKWAIACQVAASLGRIPTILGIFVTGALAMDNSPQTDDIDLFIITSPHTLWLTRLLVIAYLHFNSLRRPPSLPEHASRRVSNKICDNMYLDAHHLSLSPSNLYVAHEILQAKPLLNRLAIHRRFLTHNSWVKTYLPIAYAQSLAHSPTSPNFNTFPLPSFLIILLNVLCFFAQFLYMFPKITTERVGLGFAFFHPRSVTALSK